MQNLTEFGRVGTVIKRYFLCIKGMLTITPLEVWSASRWIDSALAVAWAIENTSPTQEEVPSLFDNRHDNISAIS
jgi:hypothetical protein